MRRRAHAASLGARPARLLDHGDEGILHRRLGAGSASPRAADLRGRALRQHLSGIHDRDAVAVFGLFHEMGGDDDGDALFGQRGDAPPEFAARQRVRAAGRLIQEQDLRLVQQGGGHGQPLLVAAGQLRAGDAAARPELELLHRPLDALALAFAAQAVGAGEKVAGSRPPLSWP